MPDLTLVGLTEDRTQLVLVTDAGEQFTLAVDARLRAALRGDDTRLGQLEMKMESALRPRDIQARIRGGESPESVAQAAQTTVDRIMSFATPVLAERAHIADRAQRASVRRRGAESGSTRILGDVVAETLRGKGVDAESVEWDSWRREDGRWTLVADFEVDDRRRRAEFLFDAPGRYVTAEDDEARWLVGDRPERRQPAERASRRRRLSAVGEEELPLGDDAIELVTGAGHDAGAAEQPDEEETVDLTGTARRVRDGSPAEEPGDADDAADTDAEAETEAGGADVDSGSRPDAEPPEPASDEEPVAEDKPKPQKKSTRKGRRASVPSWDEIMFGGGRSE
jgi:hypothetical protein